MPGWNSVFVGEVKYDTVNMRFGNVLNRLSKNCIWWLEAVYFMFVYHVKFVVRSISCSMSSCFDKMLSCYEPIKEVYHFAVQSNRNGLKTETGNDPPKLVS